MISAHLAGAVSLWHLGTSGRRHPTLSQGLELSSPKKPEIPVGLGWGGTEAAIWRILHGLLLVFVLGEAEQEKMLNLGFHQDMPMAPSTQPPQGLIYQA